MTEQQVEDLKVGDLIIYRIRRPTSFGLSGVIYYETLEGESFGVDIGLVIEKLSNSTLVEWFSDDGFSEIFHGSEIWTRIKKA